MFDKSKSSQISFIAWKIRKIGEASVNVSVAAFCKGRKQEALFVDSISWGSNMEYVICGSLSQKTVLTSFPKKLMLQRDCDETLMF